MSKGITDSMTQARRILNEGRTVTLLPGTDSATIEFTKEAQEGALEVLGIKDLYKDYQDKLSQLVGVHTLVTGDAAREADGEAKEAKHFRSDIKLGNDTLSAQYWTERERFNPSTEKKEVAKHVMANSISCSAPRNVRHNSAARKEVLAMMTADSE